MNTNWRLRGSPELEDSSRMFTSSVTEKNKSIKTSSVKLTKQTVAAAGFDVKAPIVDALIGNIKGTLPTKKSDGNDFARCDLCNCDVSSNTILDFHMKGSRHKKKLKALEIIAQLKAIGEKGVTICDGQDPNAYRCEICCLTVNSPQQLEIHLSGVKHKKKMSKENETDLESNVESNSGNIKAPKKSPGTKNIEADHVDSTPHLPKKKKKEDVKLIACDTCNVTMNSKIQYDQHLSSKKHKIKSALTNNKKYGVGNMNKRFIKFKSYGTQYFNSKFPNSNNDIKISPNQNSMNKPFPYSNFSSNNRNNHSNHSNHNNHFNGTPFMNGNNNFHSNGFKQPFRAHKFTPNDNHFQKGNQIFRGNFNSNSTMPPFMKSGPQGFQGFQRNSNF